MRRLAPLLALLAVAGCEQDKRELTWRPNIPPTSVLFEDVAVLDVTTGALTRGREVLVDGGRIEAIAPPGQIAVPGGAQRIAGRGGTLLPGLIDMHGHIGNTPEPSWQRKPPNPARNLRAYLYCGVTTVFDPADMGNVAFRRRGRVAAHELLGPRIYAAGPMITAVGGHPVALIERLVPRWLSWYLIPRFTRQVTTAEEARAAVQDIARRGPDAIKLTVDRIPNGVPRLSREALVAAAAEARRLGLRTVAHVGTAEDAVDAAQAGAALWVHGVYKERLSDEQVARLAAFRIPMVPTIAVFEAYALLGQGPRVPTPLERETVPAEVLAAFDHPPQTEASEFFREHLALMRKNRQAWRDNVRRLRAAGVTILAGSDMQMGVFPGASLHRELALLVESGMTPAEAIRSATIDAARFLANGQEPEFGVVVRGKVADLILVDGDPTADLAALGRIRAVLKEGVPLERLGINQI